MSSPPRSDTPRPARTRWREFYDRFVAEGQLGIKTPDYQLVKHPAVDPDVLGAPQAGDLLRLDALPQPGISSVAASLPPSPVKADP